MPIRYGLIGSGMMGQEHIRNLKLLENVTLTAVSDPDKEMQSLSVETSGGTAQAFSDHKDLLSANLCDAYIIAAPNDLHHAILLDVLAAGKPILCEKPLCTTSQDCRDIIAKAITHLAPNGHLALITCSIFASENQEQRQFVQDSFPELTFCSTAQYLPNAMQDGLYI